MTDDTQFVFRSGRGIGIVLGVLGIGAWVITDFASVTALIPAIFGVLIVGFAAVGRQTGRERLAVYAIGALGAFAVLGSLRAVPDIITAVTGGAVDAAVAVATQASMILFGSVLVVVAARAVVVDR